MRRGTRRRGPGLVGTMARTAVVAGTATAVHSNMTRREQDRAYAQQAQIDDAAQQAAAQQAAYAPAPAVAAPADSDAVYAEIEKLGKLKEQGLITDDEFNAKKQQLLGL